jgi:hypothetical protein
MLIGASGVGKYLWRRPMSPTSAHLLCFVASSIVRRMPLSRTQQPAADLFWAAGVGAGERASEPSIATEKSSEISDV